MPIADSSVTAPRNIAALRPCRRGQRSSVAPSQRAKPVRRISPPSSHGNQKITVRKAAARPTTENSAIWRSPGNGASPSARYASALVSNASHRPGSRCRSSFQRRSAGSAWREANQWMP
ncbi:hypothetical protein D3C71_932370 [compost metagenome]